MWKDILKARRIVSQKGKRLVESVMTTTPKNINTILDDIFKEIEKENKLMTRPHLKGYKKKKEYLTGKSIPTRKELERHLSINYSRVYLSNATNKPVTNRSEATAHYYKEE